MKRTASLSMSADVLDAARKWASDENRSLSRQVEMILADAVKRRTTARRRRAGKGVPA